MKARTGSQLAAEQKEDKIILGAISVATLLIMLCVFVFNTQLKEHMQRASTLANILGALCIVGSVVYLWWSARNFMDAKGVIIWLIALGFGIALSCGFNFGDHGTSQQEQINSDGRVPAEDLLKK